MRERENIKRRLAAILAADVAGYSRLMRGDEAGTLAVLNDHLEAVFKPKLAEHDGRIVKLMGDGILAEFASVLKAVQCALEIQTSMAERNGAAPPERQMQFRMGLNLGDVIVEGDDIHGDGVNIAARLEGLAEPGAGSVRRKRSTSRSETRSTTPSRIWANNGSRACRIRFGPIAPSSGTLGFHSRMESKSRSSTSPRSRCCRLRT